MEFLKTFFGRSNGAFSIVEIAGIKLQRDSKFKDDFYKIKNDLFIGKGFVGGLPNFGPVTEVVGQSIVPIIAQTDGENFIRCLGTGFFISCSGILVTAAHVVSDPIEREYASPLQFAGQKIRLRNIRLGIMMPTNSAFNPKGFLFREIEWCSILAEQRENPLPFKGMDLRLSADIAICKVEQNDITGHYQPLSVVQAGMKGTGLRIGKMAHAIGYGDMRDVELQATEKPNIAAGDFSFNLFASHGQILERFPDNVTTREASAPGPCFSAELKLPGGMSGSPIFDDEGIYVHGVVSRGLEDEGGLASFGYGCMLGPSLAMPLEIFGGNSVYDLLTSGDHGIAKISAPDI
jgi:hypothetical protein